LIDFYADWCAPCRQTAPILDELAREYSGKIVVYKVDVQKEKELASVFGIQSIPAFLFCPMQEILPCQQVLQCSREETKKMFIQQIENFLLKKLYESSEFIGEKGIYCITPQVEFPFAVFSFQVANGISFFGYLKSKQA